MLTLAGGLGVADPIVGFIKKAQVDVSSIITAILVIAALAVAGICLVKGVTIMRNGDIKKGLLWVAYGIFAGVLACLFPFMRKFGNNIGTKLNDESLNNVGMMIPIMYYTYKQRRLNR